MNNDFQQKLEKIYAESKKLLISTFERNYTSSGNIAIFSQSEKEYKDYKHIVNQLIIPSENSNQKYFELQSPITLAYDEYNDVITHIYIRKYDPSDYGKYSGDMDFVCSNDEYMKLKTDVLSRKIPNCTMYERTGWDTIQITHKESPVVAYLSTMEMAIKARMKFDNLTNL